MDLAANEKAVHADFFNGERRRDGDGDRDGDGRLRDGARGEAGAVCGTWGRALLERACQGVGFAAELRQQAVLLYCLHSA